MFKTYLAPRQSLTQPVWGGFNITQQVLNVQVAISSPVCNATSACIEFVAWIPKCLMLQGDPGCWCANPDPLHYCAICMSTPLDNTTNPEQTQLAGASHANYHTGCNAYETALNASVSGTITAFASESSSALTSSTSSVAPIATQASATSSGLSTGPLVGAIVGGVIGLVLIVVTGWLIYHHLQNKHEEAVAAVTRNAQQPPPPPSAMVQKPLEPHRSGQSTSPPPQFVPYIDMGVHPAPSPAYSATYEQPGRGSRVASSSFTAPQGSAGGRTSYGGSYVGPGR